MPTTPTPTSAGLRLSKSGSKSFKVTSFFHPSLSRHLQRKAATCQDRSVYASLKDPSTCSAKFSRFL
jgi:hypothetical protein